MKLCVFGYVHLAGKSKKSGNDYDFYNIDVLRRRSDNSLGSKTQAGIVSVQTPAFNNMLADYINEGTQFPVLLEVEYDNRGNIVDAGYAQGKMASDWIIENI